ncbi:MAG: bifunctional diaminohydroxyphosphoribosylaminopyrimidine deaminase/5-amino-6-(5-phosphoribosylamino)uracil reductase RibD [Sulfurimonas sp.]|nr:bifunctional diaminohydroxyphosphoribosylaminopyrimidine deaminase/5-amino-6-(5-phosphoribosylamino)uracil reductase RibD [Sulfurimonas sp.]
MVVDNNFFMSLALKEAWKYQGLTYPNPAVGCCVIGENSEIFSVEAHQKAGNPHAEVEALKSAYFKLTNNSEILQLSKSSEIHIFLLKNHNNLFKNCSLYTTLEPCSHVGKTPSCADLISSLGIKKVFVGSKDFNPDAACGNDKLTACGIEVKNDILKEECDNLLAPFGMWTKKNFVFFKWAQRLNGTTDGGTISSKESRKNVHAMRDVCDLLVIGGNTVRVDRPTLDARLVDGKAPDILILSREKEFDKTIPLFGVEGRKVMIEENLSTCQDYKNIMIEGGSNMYQLTKEFVDIYLCYIAPKFGGDENFSKIEDKFEILNLQKDKQDIIMWMKREI